MTPMPSSPDVLIACGCRLAESPIWSPAGRTLHWVDIPAGLVHRWRAETGETASWPLGEAIGSIAPCVDGSWLAATKTGIGRLVLDGGAYMPFATPEAGRPAMRFNEGKVDPRGRFLAGTMNETVREPDGTLYRLDPDLSLTPLLGDVIVPNGLCWSPDGRTMYFADTRRHAISAFDYDLDDGVPTNRRILVDLASYGGLPDGAAVDDEGCLWGALFGGGRIVRYTPDGRIDRAIALPVSQVTSLAFGGRDGRTLFVTTARHLLDEAALRSQPLAGHIFAVDAGVSGRPDPRFAGSFARRP